MSCLVLWWLSNSFFYVILDSEDEFYLSFPSNHNSRNFILGNNILQEGREKTKVMYSATRKKMLNTPTQLQRQLRRWLIPLSSSSPTKVKQWRLLMHLCWRRNWTGRRQRGKPWQETNAGNMWSIGRRIMISSHETHWDWKTVHCISFWWVFLLHHPHQRTKYLFAGSHPGSLAHLSFGKYTLYSAYATTAYGNMLALEFAMLFGNKDKENWTHFWTFIKKIHPIVD